MKYIITLSIFSQEFDSAEDAASYIVENIPEELYDDMLDECYEPVKICGYDYMPSVALRRVDETAYRCGYNDYCDSLYSDIESTISGMDAGDTEELYWHTVQCEEDEEEGQYEEDN